MRYRTFHEYLQALVEIGRVSTNNARVADALLAALQAVAQIAERRGRERLPLLGAIAEAIAHPAIQDARTELDRSQLAERLKHIEQITQVRSEQTPGGEQMAV